MKKALLPLLLCALAATAAAAPAAAKRYATAEGDDVEGMLTITGSRFELVSFANGDECDLEGRIKNGTWRDGRGCVVRFKFSGKNQDTVEVRDDGECSSYCGVKARFESVYTALPALCTKEGGKASDQRYRAAYRAKRYPEALKIKQQYVDRCIRFNGYTARIRPYNDLAESQLHTGDKAACRSTLAQIGHWFEPEIPSTFLADKTFRREQKRYEAAVKACAE